MKTIDKNGEITLTGEDMKKSMEEEFEQYRLEALSKGIKEVTKELGL